MKLSLANKAMRPCERRSDRGYKDGDPGVYSECLREKGNLDAGCCCISPFLCMSATPDSASIRLSHTHTRPWHALQKAAQLQRGSLTPESMASLWSAGSPAPDSIMWPEGHSFSSRYSPSDPLSYLFTPFSDLDGSNPASYRS